MHLCIGNNEDYYETYGIGIITHEMVQGLNLRVKSYTFINFTE